MADKIWYFARGESEHGPVTAQQIKTLATTGKLRDDDLVWREGMDDWALAAEVRELFDEPSKAASDESIESPPARGFDSPAPQRPAIRAAMVPIRHETLIRDIGFCCVLGGVLIAMMARGCDVAGSHYVARAEAEAERETGKFEDEWTRKRLELERRSAELEAKDESDPAARQMLQQAETDLAQLDDRKKQAQGLVEDNWQRLRESARNIRLSHAGWSLWRSLVFMLGAVVMTVGLVGVGMRGMGNERWVCLGILAIVVFSLFVGGDAWSALVSETSSP